MALGNFDGVHRGHQAVIAAAARHGRALGASHAVMTFEPHPREFFRPDQPPFRLTPFRIKVRQLEAMGIDNLFVLSFNNDLAAMSAEAFVVEVLSEGLQVAHVVVGYDFVFGHGRRGNAALLRDLGALHGFGVMSIEPVASDGGEIYSSTRIREHLVAGRPMQAAALLGRPWEVEGRVEHGEALGVTLGYPTANLSLGEYLHPAVGIYAVRAGIDLGRETLWRDGVAYLGRRPTVGGVKLRFEAHLFDYDGDLYGRHLRVAVIEFIRPDKKFDGLPALQAQMAEDCRRAREILASYRGPAPGAAPAVPAVRFDPADDRGFYERSLGPKEPTRT